MKKNHPDGPPPASPTAERPPAHRGEELRQAAAAAGSVPLWKEFAYFLVHNKKWWLLPILLILLGLSLFIFLSGTALAPFMYTLF